MNFDGAGSVYITRQKWSQSDWDSRDASRTASIGTVEEINDEGTVVQFVIKRDDGTIESAVGDGNLTRDALANSGLQPGDQIEYEVESWGGLTWFNPVGGMESVGSDDAAAIAQLKEIIRNFTEDIGIENLDEVEKDTLAKAQESLSRLTSKSSMRRTAQFDMSPYGWIIDKDYLAEQGFVSPDETDVGVSGGTMDDSAMTVPFRLYDDDGELYYEGRMTPSCEDNFSVGGGNPLDDFGMPNAGCTNIATNETGVWEKWAWDEKVAQEKRMMGDLELISERAREPNEVGWREPAVGRCSCGGEVQLSDGLENFCDSCGKCYNLSGQEVMSRSEWEAAGGSELAGESWDEEEY
jgi:hypothetical protein